MKVDRYQTEHRDTIGADFYPETKTDKYAIDAMKHYAKKNGDITLKLESIRLADDQRTVQQMKFEFKPEDVAYTFSLTSDLEGKMTILGLMKNYTKIAGQIKLALNPHQLPKDDRMAYAVRFIFPRMIKN